MKERDVIKVRLNNLTKKHYELENQHMLLERNTTNLRQCLDAYLIHPILGENYYNMGMDVQGCDKETMSDLKNHFVRQEEKISFYKTVTTILSAIIVTVLILLISVLIGG